MDKPCSAEEERREEKSFPYLTKENLNKDWLNSRNYFLSRFSLSAEERIKRKKYFELLFSKGSSFSISGIRVVYLFHPLETRAPAQVAFGISKKNFKAAAKRNQVRRRMKEAYRLNKHTLYSNLFDREEQLLLMLIYTDKGIRSYPEIESKIILILTRLTSRNEIDK